MVPILSTLHTHAVMYRIHVCVMVSIQEQVKIISVLLYIVCHLLLLAISTTTTVTPSESMSAAKILYETTP